MLVCLFGDTNKTENMFVLQPVSFAVEAVMVADNQRLLSKAMQCQQLPLLQVSFQYNSIECSIVIALDVTCSILWR